MDARTFLEALTTVLCVAAVTTVLFQRLHQPVVLGYIVGGLVVGPHLPFPLHVDAEIVHTLSELGVILLLFALGLEFSLRKLARMGGGAGLTTIIESSTMAWLGFMAGRLLGWGTLECLYAAAMVAISSTTIIAKAFDEQKVRSKVREIVLGVLIVEDIIAILLIAILTAVSSGSGLSAAGLAKTVLRFGAFLAALVVIGLLVVPRAVRLINRLNRPETTLIASVGICFAVALLARELGYAMALGAFVAGALVAESGETHRIAPLVQPIRDLLVGVFFVSVGMLIDPGAIVRYAPVIGIFVLVVIVGKVCSVTLGSFLAGNGVRDSVQSGMSLAQIGELSFVMAGVGVALKAIPDSLFSVAVAVSALTTLTTPWLIRLSGPAANFVDSKLPHPLQTFASLYGAWIEQIRRGPTRAKRGALLIRHGRLLVLDMAIIIVLIITGSLAEVAVTTWLQAQLGLNEAWAETALVSTVLVLCAPFGIGIFRLARRLGLELAMAALPAMPADKLDLAAAPRRALVVTLQSALLLLVGAPLVAVTQPFLSGAQAAAVLGALVLVLAVFLWRSAADLEGHVQAGAEVIAEILAAQTRQGLPAATNSLAQFTELMPGMGTPVVLRLDPQSSALGKTLHDINLRGRTGATVLAIARGEQCTTVPGAEETLQAGDVLVLVGTQEAIEAASALLRGVEV